MLLPPNQPHRTCVIADVAHLDDLAAVLAALNAVAAAGADALKVNPTVLAADLAGTLVAAARAARLTVISEPGDSGFAPPGAAWLATTPAAITHGPLLLDLARSHKPIVLGTTGATPAEVRDALGVIAFGYVAPPDATAQPRAFREAYKSAVGKAALADKVALLDGAAHLPTLAGLMKAFDLPVGWIDPADRIAVAAAAVGRGARLIVARFDAAAGAGLARYVAALRAVDATLADPPPVVRDARSHLVALAPIAPGDSFTRANLGARHTAATGISPMALWSILGKPATRAYRADDAIEAP